MFYGHQVTMHQERDGVIAKPIDHFGPVLEKDEWLKVSASLKANLIAFEMPPLIKGENTRGEVGKFIVQDPAGDLLEFKYYANFTGTVALESAQIKAVCDMEC